MLSLDVVAKNEVIIEGTLLEMDLREGTIEKRDGKPAKDYIAGTVHLRVTQPVGNVEETSDIPVSVFATKLKNNGEPNPAYKNVQEMRSNFVSMAAGGATADTVRITRGQLTENTFPSKEGRLITGMTIRNSFFNRAITDVKQMAVFQNKIVILSIVPDTNNKGEETNRLRIVGALPVWGSKVDVLTYHVEDPTAIAYISKNWNEGDTVNISGRLRFTVDTAESDAVSTEEVGFGEALPTTYTRTVKELIITSGSAGALDDDESYDAENDIMPALAARKARHAELLEKGKAKEGFSATAEAKPKAKFDPGF